MWWTLFPLFRHQPKKRKWELNLFTFQTRGLSGGRRRTRRQDLCRAQCLKNMFYCPQDKLLLRDMQGVSYFSHFASVWVIYFNQNSTFFVLWCWYGCAFSILNIKCLEIPEKAKAFQTNLQEAAWLWQVVACCYFLRAITELYVNSCWNCEDNLFLRNCTVRWNLAIFHAVKIFLQMTFITRSSLLKYKQRVFYFCGKGFTFGWQNTRKTTHKYVRPKRVAFGSICIVEASSSWCWCEPFIPA